MSGEWLPPEEKKHKCQLPDLDNPAIRYSHRPGERWKCECGKTYRIVTVSEHNESFRQWERA